MGVSMGRKRSHAAVRPSWTTVGVFRAALLVIGASALGCQPAPEDFAQRRLQLEAEFAAMHSALDQLDARLQRNERRQLEWADPRGRQLYDAAMPGAQWFQPFSTQHPGCRSRARTARKSKSAGFPTNPEGSVSGRPQGWLRRGRPGPSSRAVSSRQRLACPFRFPGDWQRSMRWSFARHGKPRLSLKPSLTSAPHRLGPHLRWRDASKASAGEAKFSQGR